MNPQNPTPPKFPYPPQTPNKNFSSVSLRVSSVILCVFLLLSSCSKSTDPLPAQILVTVSNECVCNVFLYTPEFLCLQSKIWNCQETKVLSFTTFYEGILIIKAEYKDKSTSQSITAISGKIIEVGIIF